MKLEDQTKSVAKILVIDDEIVVRQFIRAVLEDAGYNVTEAEDGKHGINLRRETIFDLIVTDVVMPEKDGIETLLELRILHPEQKILAISGKWDGYLVAAKAFGATETLRKPLSPENLVRCVDRCLSQ